MFQAIVVQTTTETESEAEAIAELLLERRLAACVQITPIRSRYVWRGQVARADEQLLAIKTRAELFEAVREAIRAQHSYETPEILGVAAAAVDPAYLAWLTEATRTAEN
jgi:periplasmic divalent cation tolerance protein